MSPMNVVQFFEEAPIVNSSCCSDPRVKCPKCAAAALALMSTAEDAGEDAGLTRNIDPGTADDLDMRPPVVNYADEAADAYRSPTARQAERARAEAEALVTNLWAAADGPAADV